MSRPEVPCYSHQSLAHVPEPVLFNAWKHHACVLRLRIQQYAARGTDGLTELADKVTVIGHGLMDLYHGGLWPNDIAGRAIKELRTDNRLEFAGYRAWLQENGGYRILTFAEADSRWVLRMGDETGRHVHVHPGRWSPMTVRVRANVLKTAVLVNAYVLTCGGDPFDITLINAVRRQYLDLSHMRSLATDQGLREILELVKSTMDIE